MEAFKYALERLQADPNAIDPKIEKSIFEKVLETPDKAEYINLCIDNGADLYLVSFQLSDPTKLLQISTNCLIQ